MESTSGFFRYCFSLLSRREKRDFYLLLILGLASAFAELVGLAAVLPVISILAGGTSSMAFPWLADLFPAEHGPKLLYQVGMVSVSIVLAAACVHLLYTYAKYRYVRRVAAALSTRVFRNYISDPLEEFLDRSQAEMVRNVGQIGDKVSNDVIESGVHIITRFGLLLLVLAWLLTVSPQLALVIGVALGTIYFLVHGWVKSYIDKTVNKNFHHYKTLHQLKVDAYQAIRQVRIDALEQNILDNFSAKKREVCRGEANIAIVGEVPRFALEASGITLLILSAMYMNETTAREYLLPNMAVFALAAYRILPAIQQIYHCVNRLTTARAIHTEVVESMALREDLPAVDDAVQMTIDAAGLGDVSYLYPGEERPALESASLDIPLQGVCLVSGASGSGKSTLFDLLLGLRVPAAGTIRVGGRDISTALGNWWSSISYIPQDFHIFGRSIRDVVTGGSQGDFYPERYAQALSVSGLDAFISKRDLSDTQADIETLAVSGGERCRLALARAFYSGSPVVFMDEPFAALDLDSASAVVRRMREAYPDRCFLIISHRHDEIDHWDHLVDLSQVNGTSADE